MAKMAMRIAPAYQGRGLRRRPQKLLLCLTQTELQPIWTDVDNRNTASCKVLVEYGFTKEGMIRQGRMVNMWCDYYIYGLRKTDFEEFGNENRNRQADAAGNDR